MRGWGCVAPLQPGFWGGNIFWTGTVPQPWTVSREVVPLPRSANVCAPTQEPNQTTAVPPRPFLPLLAQIARHARRSSSLPRHVPCSNPTEVVYARSLTAPPPAPSGPGARGLSRGVSTGILQALARLPDPGLCRARVARPGRARRAWQSAGAGAPAGRSCQAPWAAQQREPGTEARSRRAHQAGPGGARTACPGRPEGRLARRSPGLAGACPAEIPPGAAAGGRADHQRAENCWCCRRPLGRELLALAAGREGAVGRDPWRLGHRPRFRGCKALWRPD